MENLLTMTNLNGYVLFVDDDNDDQEILLECCHELQLAEKAHFVQSGDELFRFLTEIKSPKSLPSLIVLDINMPEMNGEEILLQLKRDPRYRHIPVVFYSTGSRCQSKYLDLGAEAFYCKPPNYAELREHVLSFFKRLSPSAFS